MIESGERGGAGQGERQSGREGMEPRGAARGQEGQNSPGGLESQEGADGRSGMEGREGQVSQEGQESQEGQADQEERAHPDAAQAGSGAGASALQGGVIAVIDGKPLTSMPKELYIPPGALNVFLERFDGPLDLLLFLIRRQRFDVMRIPMETVTRQYIEYIAQIDRAHFDLSADYLCMAAILIEIKSRMLLPQAKKEGEEGEGADPRAELARRLLAYEKFKELAALLDARPREGREWFRARLRVEPIARINPPAATVADLRKSLARVLMRAHVNKEHKVTVKSISVRERMARILRFLKDRGEMIIDAEFIGSKGCDETVAILLAALELCKGGELDVEQKEPYGPIVLSRPA